MNVHFKRLTELESRMALLTCTVITVKKRIYRHQRKEMLIERNRQRAELQLPPVEQ